jgi:Raf kinase inhibitor-like YbhB/YbcL family protein
MQMEFYRASFVRDDAARQHQWRIKMPGLRYMFAVVSGAMLLAGNVFAADPFTLNSSSFKDGTLLPKKMASDNKVNPNCVGEKVSPALEWKNPPAGPVSYALIMTDPEGRGGLGVDHWHAYGIPASVTSFAEGETSKTSDKYVGGKGTASKDFYMGPCTPPGAPHHYTFIIVATDLDPKALPSGLTRLELLGKAQRSHQGRRRHGRPVSQPLLTFG